MYTKEWKVMSIITTNPAKITIQLIDHQNLDQEQLFQLAHHIDAYEIEKQLQESVVFDIIKITKSGEIDLIITPKIGLKYNELKEHLDTVINYALENVNLGGCKWEVLKITFLTEAPGKPSYVFNNLHEAFKAD